jgi:hypothetical protein
MHYEIAMSERMIDLEFRKDDKSITADSFVSDLITEIQSRTTDSNRLHRFAIHYNKEFKKQQLMDIFFRYVIQPDILELMKGPLTLYALNMNGQVLIDLAGILERYAIIYITELFGSFPARQDVVRQLLERQFLYKLAKHLIILGLWDKKDEKEILKLQKARNGVAHKNEEIVRKELNNGKPIFSNYDSTNIVPYHRTSYRVWLGSSTSLACLLKSFAFNSSYFNMNIFITWSVISNLRLRSSAHFIC